MTLLIITSILSTLLIPVVISFYRKERVERHERDQLNGVMDAMDTKQNSEISDIVDAQIGGQDTTETLVKFQQKYTGHTQRREAVEEYESIFAERVAPEYQKVQQELLAVLEKRGRS